jgi:hypothetical protein
MRAIFDVQFWSVTAGNSILKYFINYLNAHLVDVITVSLFAFPNIAINFVHQELTGHHTNRD